MAGDLHRGIEDEPPRVRYAIYFMPHEASPLWQFGSSVLGFDAAAFADVAYPDDPIFRDPSTWTYTAGPRQYGFHATLKAPFHLRSDRSVDELEAQLRAFAAGRQPFGLRLKLATMRDFFALVAAQSPADLDRLADACVREFDGFRAPTTAEDRERRHPDRLSRRELETLDRWGYPFCFEDFRFHMTLTGAMDLASQIRFGPVLNRLFGLIDPNIEVDAIALFRQDERNGRFMVQRRFPFGARAAER